MEIRPRSAGSVSRFHRERKSGSRFCLKMPKAFETHFKRCLPQILRCSFRFRRTVDFTTAVWDSISAGLHHEKRFREQERSERVRAKACARKNEPPRHQGHHGRGRAEISTGRTVASPCVGSRSPMSNGVGLGEKFEFRASNFFPYTISSTSSPTLTVISPPSCSRRTTSTICCCTCSTAECFTGPR